MYTYKVMIHPNNKQETKIRRTLNKCIECNNIVYDYLDNFIKSKEPFPKCGDVRKWFTIQKSIKDNEAIKMRKNMTKSEMIKAHLDTLFYDVSNDALKQEIKDTYNSFIRFFKKLSKYPVKKSYKSYKKSFYVDPYKISFSDSKVKLEKIANNQKTNRQVLNYISLAEKNRIPIKVAYYNPRVILEGDRLYIVVSVDEKMEPKKKIDTIKDKMIGIDININSVVTSDNEFFSSATNTIKYKKANKKLKRAQKSLSRKYLDAKKLNKPLSESKNYIKQRKIKNKYQRKLNNIKDAHDDNLIKALIDKRPNKILIEDLNIKKMQSSNKEGSKYIRSGIQKNGWAKLIKKLEYKCYKVGIDIVKIDRYYPSSKKCHNCGTIKDNLKLSDRVFICPMCGTRINRDYNAALNIRDYK